MREWYSFPVVDPITSVIPMRLGDPYSVPKYKWLRKLLGALGLLKQSHYNKYDTKFSRIDLREDTVFNVIRVGLHSIGRARREQPKRIYVGFDQFENLMKDDVCAHYLPLMFPVKMFGADIILTPYLDGILPVWEGEQ